MGLIKKISNAFASVTTFNHSSHTKDKNVSISVTISFTIT